MLITVSFKHILQRGPDYFPELLQAGKSIIHGDLQTPNMGCSNVGEAVWDIKFLDWEGARLRPVGLICSI